MKPTKPTSPKVSPPDTWAVHSPYGVLKNIKGDGLERLEAIHAFLMERDRLLTSADAAVRVFGPFMADANSALGMKLGAAKLRPFLHIVDPSQRANSIGDFAGRKHLATLAELVPYVHHTHFERGTPEALFYALGVMAGEVWAPHSGDIDLNDRWGDDCPEGYFPSAARCRAILGPLAVPFDLAHALWGWGDVAQVVQLHAVAAEAVEPNTYRELVTFRKANQNSEWTTSQKGIAASEAKRRKALPGAKKVANEMAKELGVSVSRFNALIRSHATAGKRETVRVKSA